MGPSEGKQRVCDGLESRIKLWNSAAGPLHLPPLAPISSNLKQSQEMEMPRGDKSKYTDKQERKAEHIGESYEQKGVPDSEAERRTWATVNKDDGGGKAGGSGENAHTGHLAAHKVGALGGKAAAKRPAKARAATAKKAAATRKRKTAA
jgi:plasmid stabilization system protein ParE